jgi:hypothetical protein
MAASLHAILARFGKIRQDELAESFACHYHADRGYGPAMHGHLLRIRNQIPRQTATRLLFQGHGSMGNGAAMRAAPVGAYFADDLDAAEEQCRLSAEVTHVHPDGIAGAVAVGVAAALAVRMRGAPAPPPSEFLWQVHARTPEGMVRDGLHRAAGLPAGASVQLAVPALLCSLPCRRFCAACRAGAWERDTGNRARHRAFRPVVRRSTPG